MEASTFRNSPNFSCIVNTLRGVFHFLQKNISSLEAFLERVAMSSAASSPVMDALAAHPVSVAVVLGAHRSLSGDCPSSQSLCQLTVMLTFDSAQLLLALVARLPLKQKEPMGRPSHQLLTSPQL